MMAQCQATTWTLPYYALGLTVYIKAVVTMPRYQKLHWHYHLVLIGTHKHTSEAVVGGAPARVTIDFSYSSSTLGTYTGLIIASMCIKNHINSKPTIVPSSTGRIHVCHRKF